MKETASSSFNVDFQQVFDTSLDAIFIFDGTGRILDANPTALRRYGYSLAELRRMDVAELSATDFRDKVADRISMSLQASEIFEWQHLCRDGRIVPVEIYAQPMLLRGQPVVLSSARDISQRIAVATELHLKTHLLESILDAEPGTVYIYDLVGRKNVYVNEHWHTAFGYTPEETLAQGDALKTLFHPDDMAAIDANHEAWRTTSEGVTRVIEYRVRDKAGNWHWLLSRETAFVRDPSGMVLQILGIASDITSRKQAEEERELFVSLATNSKEFIGMADLDMVPFYVNDAALQMSGLPDIEAARRVKVQDFFFLEDQRFITQDFLPRALREGNAEVEIRFRHFQTGQPIWMLYNVFAIHDSRGNTAGWATVSRNITDRKNTEDTLLISEQRFRNYMDNAPTVAWMKDAAGRYVYVSGAYERRFGISREEALGHTDFDLWPRSLAEKFQETDRRALEDNKVCDVVEQSVNADGSESWWRNFKFPFHDLSGSSHVGGIGLDITEQKRSDAKILRLTQVYAALSHCNQAIVRCHDEAALFAEICRDTVEFGGMEMVWIGLIDTAVAKVKPAAAFGSGIAYLDGLAISIRSCDPDGNGPTGIAIRENHPVWCQDFQHDPRTARWHERAERFGWRASASLPLYRRGDVIGTLNLYTATVNAFDDTTRDLLEKITADISAALDRFVSESQHKKDEARIQYLANFDALTGLPNRTQLVDHLKYALSLAKRSHGSVALMFIDLDRFKDINDTLGHSAGDAVLIEVARRLRATLREEDTASRLGGDEFIVILAEVDMRGATHVAEKLLHAIAAPYRLDDYDLVLTASIGITLCPDDGVELETLSRNADTAMYRAKSEGRHCYRFFTAEMQAEAIRNMQLIHALRFALERGQLEVRYQPQHTIRHSRMIGVEALLRWRHPELGRVAPSEFIAVAEDCGLILPIGEWVLQTAVRQVKRWMDAGYPPITVAVNLSAAQFRHPGLPDMVSHILGAEGLPARYLELELTESVAMHDPANAIAVMNQMHERGIRMSIDDFGTGYSSLNYLKKFKVYRLKIDRSFVRDLKTDAEDRAIVSAVVSMARSLGMKTIAEGVETAEQLDFLRELGCDEAQGFFFSKPMPAEAIEAMLAE
jgi:diguanylate cyclase (GGDEF)-like protein/PAS domain S-box-containing protein